MSGKHILNNYMLIIYMELYICFAEYIDEICPYATFQLSKPSFSDGSFSGNVYSGPYHSVGGSFVYHNVKSSSSSMKQKYVIPHL